MRALSWLLLAVFAPGAWATDWPLFDAHIHYSQDVWAAVPPAQAIARLKEAGLSGAMVSSSPDEGTQMLRRVAPQFVVPALRPYRRHDERRTWMHDPGVVPYLEQRLASDRYVAIGEFHIYGADAELPIVRQVVALAHGHHLILHVHSDADAIERVFRQQPRARILWAHAGFEQATRVRELMERHETLWADLAFRREIFANGRLLTDWRSLLIDHNDRFMVGVDTYTPQRWLQVQTVADGLRAMLDTLPEETAERIAYRNAERLLVIP